MSGLPRGKVWLLTGIVLLYLVAGVLFRLSVLANVVPAAPPTVELQEEEIPYVRAQENLDAAIRYLESALIREDGHIELYRVIDENATFGPDDDTNSEAASYYLLWNARAGDKEAFDRELSYIERHMLHPRAGYLMWRLDERGAAVDDGSNIASDADLRAIEALAIAERTWGDQRYARTIGLLADGIERIAVTKDGYLAPYGGMSGATPWSVEEVWISYVNFNAIDELGRRFGEPWETMHARMKEAALEAQIHNGLYNSQLTLQRRYGNGIDGGGYSINSLWIMVRSAESDDPELQASARDGLAFYKGRYEQDTKLYTSYSSSGDPLSSSDSPWVYALVGRAAVALGDLEFAESMVNELISHQVLDPGSPHYGAIVEGEQGNRRVGQFTMQESILTLQRFVDARIDSAVESRTNG